MIAMSMFGFTFGLVAFVLVGQLTRRVKRLETEVERLSRKVRH